MDGSPVLVGPGAASVSLSEEGSLLCMEGAEAGGLRQMLWLDRSGNELEQVGGACPGLSRLALSPDGRRFLVARDANPENGRPSRMVLVQNWEAALADRAGR